MHRKLTMYKYKNIEYSYYYGSGLVAFAYSLVTTAKW